MSKKRSRAKNDALSGSQSKLSKYFSQKAVPKQSAKATKDEKTVDSSQPVGKVQKVDSNEIPNVSMEDIHILPETSQKLRNFAHKEGVSSLTDATCSVLQSSDGVISPLKNSEKFAECTVTDVSAEDENLASSKRAKDESCSSNKPRKEKYTPLEMQYLDLKKDYPDAILLIQCGYKYRIFGEDAQIASKELGFGCYMNHNFLSSSFPVQRLAVHVRRLVSKGFKVGVVNQTETAATKAAGDSKNTLFSRKLHALYTQSTLIGEDFDCASASIADDFPNYEAPLVSGYLMCICDKEQYNSQGKNVVGIGVMAVNASTGDVLYASFEDSASRSTLEACFSQVSPVELLLPTCSLSSGTENLIRSISDTSGLLRGSNLRVERIEDGIFDFTCALPFVSQFYSLRKEKDNSVETCNGKNNLREVLSLPPLVLCCLSSLISYLKEFNLETLLQEWRHFKPLFNSSQFMFLNATTIRNLELFRNSVNFAEEGSLFRTINFTSTKFGEKLLKSWLMNPLRDMQKIDERLNSVASVVHSDSPVWDILRKMLFKLPDLERLLCASFYHRCSCAEFLNLSKTLMEIKNNIVNISDAIIANLNVESLKEIILSVPFLLQNIDNFVVNVDESAARTGDKTKLFIDSSGFPKVSECREKIKSVLEKLEKLKVEIAKTLRLPAFQYTEVMGNKFLIEVKNAMSPLVPTDWLKISSTKQLSRYRSPEVNAFCAELQQLTEELEVHCNEAWHSFLNEFGTYFYKYKKAVSQLAELDCIFSLVKLAKQDGYCRPVIVDNEEHKLEIKQGRNPIVCKLLGESQQYVANDTVLDSIKRCMIITGPNMGGKSSYVRQVALISILAQIGSYVPATSASLPLFDGVYVRMGAEDDIFSQRSTFMTEMCETSTILSSASDNSLVILDELGRGTSTHDGTAIAHAVLHHILTEVKCITLFVTHYPQIADQLHESFPENVYTCHMAFCIGSDNDDETNSSVGDVTFLYSTVCGIASKSYGINVARLAGIPKEILNKAKCISAELERQTSRRRSDALSFVWIKL